MDRYHNCVYRHYILYSNDVAFFKDDQGKDLDQVIYTDVITLPAPNLKDTRTVRTLNEFAYAKVIKNRLMGMAAVLNIMHPDLVVLGAWGCGAFRNDPKQIGKLFAQVVPFLDVKKVVFSIPKDASQNDQKFKSSYYSKQ